MVRPPIDRMRSVDALRIIRILWAGPNSLIGLSLLPFFRRRRVVRGVILGEGAGWPRRFGWRYSAITFGHVVLSVDEPISGRVFEHELAHVRQYEIFGPLYLLLYVLSSLVALARGGHHYRDNAFEAHARAHEGSVMKRT